MNVAFNAIAYIKQLRDAGVPNQQAEIQAQAMIDIIDQNLATKFDIKELEAKIMATKFDIKELDVKLETKIEVLKKDLTIKMFVIAATTVTVLAAIIQMN